MISLVQLLSFSLLHRSSLEELKLKVHLVQLIATHLIAKQYIWRILIVKLQIQGVAAK